MSIETGFGWFFVVLGALQGWSSYRARIRRGDQLFLGAMLAAFGASVLLRHQGPVLSTASTFLVVAVNVVQVARHRKDHRRAFIVVVTLGALALIGEMLNALGYFENIPKGIERMFNWAIAAVMAGLFLWALFIIARAVIRPFRPLPPPS